MNILKNALIVLVGVFSFSCGVSVPSEEEMKEEQTAYELNKTEVLKTKGSFYKDNSSLLLQKATLILAVLNDSVGSQDINSDSTYIHNKEISFIDLTKKSRYDISKREIDEELNSHTKKVFIVSKKEMKSNNTYQIISTIKTCEELQSNQACIQLNEKD